MMANVITGLRIFVSMGLLYSPVFSHSTMNKVTGVLLFMLPFALSIVPLIYSVIPICSVGTFAAVQEYGILHSPEGKSKKPSDF